MYGVGDVALFFGLGNCVGGGLGVVWFFVGMLVFVGLGSCVCGGLRVGTSVLV